MGLGVKGTCEEAANELQLVEFRTDVIDFSAAHAEMPLHGHLTDGYGIHDAYVIFRNDCSGAVGAITVSIGHYVLTAAGVKVSKTAGSIVNAQALSETKVAGEIQKLSIETTLAAKGPRGRSSARIAAPFSIYATWAEGTNTAEGVIVLRLRKLDNKYKTV